MMPTSAKIDGADNDGAEINLLNSRKVLYSPHVPTSRLNIISLFYIWYIQR